MIQYTFGRKDTTFFWNMQINYEKTKKNPTLYLLIGGRGYPERRYPIACKQAARPQGSRRSMFALFPRSGNSSGASLVMPFKALLHFFEVDVFGGGVATVGGVV